jgi:hypothetical protein
MKKITILFLFVSLSLFAQKQIFVVTTNPVKGEYTLQEALMAVQKLNSRGTYPDQGITILIEEGEYAMEKGFRLFKNHSGTSKAPLVIKAKKGHRVVFFGGAYVNEDWFTPLKDKTVLDRIISEEAKSKILTVNLKKHGIRNLGTLSKHGWQMEPFSRIAPAGLSIGGERMELARWPNKNEESPFLEEKAKVGNLRGMVSYTKIIDKGPKKPRVRDWYKKKDFMTKGGTFEVGFDRMNLWQDIQNVWLDGVLGTTWEWTYNNIKSIDKAHKTITLASGELNGLGGGLPRLSHFYFENILEEIDLPGEYVMDRDKGILYLYPPENFKGKSIYVSSLQENVFHILNASWIRIEDIIIDSGCKNGIIVDKSNHISILNTEIKNVAMGGVMLSGNFNTLRNSKIHDVGSYGVTLKGGDKKTLRPGNNLVENCEIYSLAWDQKSQMAGIFFDKGVGNYARNNELYDMPHFAIRMHYTNDCIVENNKIHDLPTYHMFDGGAVYIYTSPLNPSNRGNYYRSNYMYNVPTNGIYCDNYAMGVFMQKNYFKNVSYLDSEWGFGAIMLNTGGQNYMEDNIFVDCRIPILHGNGGYHNSYKGKPHIQKAWNNAVQKYGNGKIENTPYAKYSTFKDFLALSPERDYAAFKFPLSYANRNLFYNPTVPLEAAANKPKGICNKRNKVIAKDNYYAEKNPGFKKKSLVLSDKDLLQIPIKNSSFGDFLTIGIKTKK